MTPNPPGRGGSNPEAAAAPGALRRSTPTSNGSTTTATRPHPTTNALSSRPRRAEIDSSNVGGGTALVLMYVGLIPGVIPTLVLTVVAAAVIVVPMLALGIAAAIVVGPPYAVWRLINERRKRTRRDSSTVSLSQAAAPSVG